MKKLIGPFAKVFGGLFAVGVFVIIISLSYSALGRVFPGSLFDQAAGLLLFDISALVWFMQFVGGSRSVSQYVYSGLGFLLGLLGSIGLVGIEVGISSGMLIAEEMTKPLSYIFIGAAVGHLMVLYAFHGSEPAISAEISLGVEKAKVHDEGMRQAEEMLKRDMAQLGREISLRLVDDVKRDLRLPGQVIDLPALPMDDSLHVPSNGYSTQEQAASFFENPKEWISQRLGKKQSGKTPEDGEVAWVEDLNGNRVRVYCLKCMRAGKEWRTPEPCQHVQNAIGEPMRPMSTGYASTVAGASIPDEAGGGSTATEPASKPNTESAS